MTRNNFNTFTRIYKHRCQPLEMQFFYRMLLMRISRGLSPEEVSFLMGKALDFTIKVESFKIKTILAMDYYMFCRVLEVGSIHAMMPVGMNISKEKYAYELHFTTLADEVVYHLYRLSAEEGTKEIEFQLLDIRHDFNPNKPSTLNEIRKIKRIIEAQVGTGYFNKNRSPYEIHKLVCIILDTYVKPKNLMRVLEDLLNRSDELKLIRKESKSGFIYVLRIS
ncbi:hypothetical protein [Sphingobacterium sp.]|uniref:hypothetical protein n=1 Tax=Sphingobacterium sp. TaxID=341027 RepID=UPI0028A0A4CC|nr:hypothetical protein [Sphingobacterium sp.]